MKDSLKKQDQAVSGMKKSMDDLRKTVERTYDIDIPKPQRSTLLVHPDDMKKRSDYYDNKYHQKKHFH